MSYATEHGPKTSKENSSKETINKTIQVIQKTFMYDAFRRYHTFPSLRGTTSPIRATRGGNCKI